MNKRKYEQELNEIFSLPENKIENRLKKLIRQQTNAKNYAIAHDASFHLAAFYYESDHLTSAKRILIPIVTNYMNYRFIPRYANMFMLLGLIELGEEDFTLANYYFESGLRLAKVHHLPKVICLAYSNLAIVDSGMGRNEQALEHLLMSEKYIDHTNEEQHVLLYLNLAVCYKLLKQLENSKRYLNKCIQEYHGLDTGRRDLIRCCQMDLAYQMGDVDSYEVMKEEILQEDNEISTPDQVQAYQMICENAFRDGDYELSSKLLKRLKKDITKKEDMATQLFVAKCEGELARQSNDKDKYIESLESQLKLTKKMNELTSQQLIRSTGVEVRLAKLMQKNENAKRAQEKEREHARVLVEALEMTEKANAAKSEFLSRMSHEIRTPLNAVIGYMGIAQSEEIENEKVQHCLSNSELAAKHLLSIINDVLDVSAIESGRIKIAKSDYNLKQQISTAATIFYNQAKNRNVDFRVNLVGFTEEWVIGDSLRVNQIIMNLLSNAVKFTSEKGQVTLNVTQLDKTDHKVIMQFQVSDTGIGMSKEFLSRMFTPFEQESAGTAQKFGGTGLGLAISKNLATLMDGTIEVDSELNVGTTFTVTLPFGISKENGKIMSTGKDFSKIRVLVVDDQKADQTYVKQVLKRLNVKADTCSDGETAVRRFIGRQNTDYAYDLCIIDWKMPGITGFDVAKRIREAAGEELPIIIATAYDITEIDEEAKRAGVNKVIAKPLFQSSLLDLLMDSFGGYRPKGEIEVASNFNLEGTKVLLAEDNHMNMEIAVSILTKAGIHVDEAYNGKEAVDKFEASSPGDYDAILMDVQMPVMGGYEATQMIRASKHEAAKIIPIIAMTANAFTEDIEKALKSGMNGHISKLVDYEKLYRTLSECMKNRAK